MELTSDEVVRFAHFLKVRGEENGRLSHAEWERQTAVSLYALKDALRMLLERSTPVVSSGRAWRCWPACVSG